MSGDIANELRAGLANVTPGPWQVTTSRHAWSLRADQERGHAQRNGHHIERRIATVANHPQSKAPWPVIGIAIGVGVDEPVHFVHVTEDDAAHIANCSPDRISSLLDALDAKDKRIAELEAALEPFAKRAAQGIGPGYMSTVKDEWLYTARRLLSSPAGEANG